MMEAVCTSETSVHFNVTTWYYIPEDSKPFREEFGIENLSAELKDEHLQWSDHLNRMATTKISRETKLKFKGKRPMR
jgi:hypothetical protein